MYINDNSNADNTPVLITFGEDFEKYGGMRALALSRTYDEDGPDEFQNEEVIQVCEDILGPKMAKEGFECEQKFHAFHYACYDLRMVYGHDVWIIQALHDYLTICKGMDDEGAAELSNDMLEEARARYAPIHAHYIYKCNVELVPSQTMRIECDKNIVKLMMTSIADRKNRIRRAKKEIEAYEKAHPEAVAA